MWKKMSMDNYILVKEVNHLYKIYDGCASSGSKSLVGTAKTLRNAIKLASELGSEYGISFVLKKDSKK